MPDEDLVERLVSVSRELVAESPNGEIDAKEVAAKLGKDIDSTALHHAFKVAADRGLLRCEAWEGGMGLPAMVRI